MHYAGHDVCMHKCNMIKRNESDVGNIDFEIEAKIGDNCLCFMLF